MCAFLKQMLHPLLPFGVAGNGGHIFAMSWVPLTVHTLIARHLQKTCTQLGIARAVYLRTALQLCPLICAFYSSQVAGMGVQPMHPCILLLVCGIFSYRQANAI
jgi:hypothetical protein